jgi:hypothetical protein
MLVKDLAAQRWQRDREFRRDRRFLAFLMDFWRHAQIMALLVLLSDLTPWPLGADRTPGQRAFFVLGWAFLMALIYVVRPSLLEPKAPQDRDATTS